MKIFGCGELTAAKLLGQTAGVSCFRSEAAFASYAGVAPTPHWSGQTTTRPMAARTGNRQLNAALYRIAMTQIKRNGPATAYYRKRRDAGDSHAEAIRRVERRVARCVFAHLRADTTNLPGDARSV